MNIKHSIGLNLSAYSIPCRMHMVQGDSNSRTIVATLWDGAQPYSVPDGSSVMVRFRKPDGTGGLYDSSEAGETISYAGNVVTAPVATQMLAVAGDVFAEIDIFGSGSGTAAERLATFRFVVEVAPCVLPDAEIISSDYYNVIAADIASAKAAADLAKDYAAAAKNSADSAATSAEGAVKYNAPQTLTEAQKQQARDNIGADVSTASPTQLGLVQPVAKTDAMTRSIGVDDSGRLYTEPAAWYLSITGTPDAPIGDKTPAEIYQAYTGGYAVYAVVQMANLYDGIPFTLPLVAIAPVGGSYIVCFSTLAEPHLHDASIIEITATWNRRWYLFISEIASKDDKLPNPYKLRITSGDTTVTYDGSTPENIDIPAGGAVCNANLLRNGTFADGCIVNQRGKTSYAGTGYGVDMWYITGATLSVDVTAEGVKLYKNDATANPAWAQALETDAAVGQTVTVSMLYKGNGEGASLRVAQSGGSATLSNVSDWTLVQKTFALEKWSVGTLQDRAIVAIQCFENMAANQGLYIKAIKLELGEQQTLAHQNGDGAWVLNELPDYGGELLRCQRYYQVYTTAAARPAKALDCRPVMRTDPAQSTVSVGGATLYANSAEL